MIRQLTRMVGQMQQQLHEMRRDQHERESAPPAASAQFQEGDLARRQAWVADRELEATMAECFCQFVRVKTGKPESRESSELRLQFWLCVYPSVQHSGLVTHLRAGQFRELWVAITATDAP